MAHVFMSFAEQDAEIARAIVEAIEQAGIHVSRSTSLETANDRTVAGEPDELLEAAQCSILLWSSATARSGFDHEAVRLALRAWSEERLVIATLDDTALPVGMRDLPGIPVQKSQNGIDATDLVAELQSTLARSPHGDPAAASEGPSATGEVLASIAIPPARLSPYRPRRRYRLALLVAVLLLTAGATTWLVLPDRRDTASWKSVPVAKFDEDAARKLRERMERERAEQERANGTPDVEEMQKTGPRRRLRTRTSPPATEVSPPIQSPAPSSAPPPDSRSPAPGAGPPLGAPSRSSDIVLFLLAMLALGIALGAASMWAWSLRSNRRRQRARPTAPLQAATLSADPAHQVFVSYSRQDGSAVETLVKEIEHAGYAVWIDRHSTGSQRYAAPIVRAIKSSRIVALMCSRNSFTSDHVIREVYVAGDYKKSFIAFQLDHSEFPDEVQYFVSGFPRVQLEALDVQQLRSELARLVAA
jgi:hypothetical protein